MFQTILKLKFFIAGIAILSMACACDGVLDSIYDDPTDEPMAKVQGQLVVNARSWGDWYYVSFDSLQQYVASGDTVGLLYAQTHFTPYPIPMESTGSSTDTASQSAGIYTYWFDVFGKGMSNNELREFRPTKEQPEPAVWDIAIHRQNVRTNGASVLETNYTSLDELPENSSYFTGATFTPDEWSQKDVWADQSQMLLSLIGCQGISINKPLSSMLVVKIPPMPPSYEINNHVFLIKLKNGNIAALQLVNYMDEKGNTCVLTFNYKYPY